jgi:Flp pilus assembly protein TadG
MTSHHGRGGHDRARGHDDGQAAVELALVLPLLVAVLAGLVQVGLIVRDQVLLVHGVREAVRQLSVQDDRAPPTSAQQTAAATNAAIAATGRVLHRDLLTITVDEHGGRVAVRAGYHAPVRLPVVDWAARYVPLTAYAEMQVEKN